mgnify:FL=1
MSMRRRSRLARENRSEIISDDYDKGESIIPIVSDNPEHKIKIYAPDGSYYYRDIGFLSNIVSE